MILDNGICGIGRIQNGPTPHGTLLNPAQYWFGELDFASSPYGDEGRVDTQEERRIRILQDRRITGLFGVQIDQTRYEITRIFHGRDNDSGELITDLTLHRVMTGGEDGV